MATTEDTTKAKDRKYIPQTIDEKIQYGHTLKSEGNDLFSNQQYKKAIAKYRSVFLYINGLDQNAMNILAGNSGRDKGSDSEEVQQLRLHCHLNIAACQLKLKQYDKAQKAAEDALEIEESNVKGLFRRGQAAMGRKNAEQAKKDFEKVKNLQGDQYGKIIDHLMKKLKIMEKQQDADSKKLFSGMFAKMNAT